MKKDKHLPYVFVCSPYRPKSSDPAEALVELAVNTERVQKACRILSRMGYIPLVPHLYFTSFLRDDDEAERETGIQMGMQWLEKSSEMFCFGDEITEGMALEMAKARELGIPIRMLPEPDDLIKELIEVMHEEENDVE